MSATPGLVAMVRAKHERQALACSERARRAGDHHETWESKVEGWRVARLRHEHAARAAEQRAREKEAEKERLEQEARNHAEQARKAAAEAADIESEIGKLPIGRPAGPHATIWMHCAATTSGVWRPWRAWRANASRVFAGRNVKSTETGRRRKSALQERSAISTASKSTPRPRATGFKRLRLLPKQTSKRHGQTRPTLAARRRAPARSTARKRSDESRRSIRSRLSTCALSTRRRLRALRRSGANHR